MAVRIKAGVLSAIFAATWLCGPPAIAAATLGFSQVDFYQNNSLAISNSEWGEFNISYSQGSTLQWMNVVADPGTPNARWIVQNHPVLPSGLTGTSTYSSNSYFDLGTPRGTPVSSLNVGYVMTAAPATAAPVLFDASASFVLGTSQNIINSGVPSGVATQGAPDNGNINWNVPFAGLTTNFHKDMPNVVQEDSWCGPGAATNSLHWLNSEHGLGLTQTLLETQTELAANMMNTHKGNWDDKEVQGKLQYFADHHLPLEVHYVGGARLPTNGNYVDPNGNGIARNNGPVNWEWIESEMAKGQDIEFMTSTHWVVLEGLISWDGIHLVSYRDDPFQHGAATTAAERNTIANRHVWSYFSNGFTNIGNGQEVLRTAIAESVPEPPVPWLLALGLVAVLAIRGKPRAAGTNAQIDAR